MIIHYDVPRVWGKTHEIIGKLESESNSYCLLPEKPFIDQYKSKASEESFEKVYPFSNLRHLIHAMKKNQANTLYIDEFYLFDFEEPNELNIHSQDELIEFLLSNGVYNIISYSTSRAVERSQRKAREIVGNYFRELSEISLTISNDKNVRI